MSIGARIVEFRTEYQPDGNGNYKAVDWVDISPHGMEKYTTTPHRIADLQRSMDPGADSSLLWTYVRPKYEAWKANEELPENGTPLAAWPGVTSQQVKVLKKFDVRTVEDIADMHDNTMAHIPLPNMRALRDQARAFDAAKSQRGVETQIASLTEQNEILQQRLEEMADMIAMRDNTEEPVKRRPGRPRKEPDEEAAA